METIKKFEVEKGDLSRNEKLVLERLIKACELTAFLFEKQIGPDFEKVNFYPQEVFKGEIKEAAKKNAKILHPYTFVEKDRKGKLIAVPFRVKFKRELKEIAKFLDEAAKISEDKGFSNYLRELSRSLFKDDYARNEMLWVTRGPFKLDFMIGPVERYFDRIFFKKCAYQAWVGVRDEAKTEEMERLQKIILAGRRNVFPGTSKFDIPKLLIGVNKTVVFAGQKAVFMTIGTNLPNDNALMEKYGSRLEIFDSSHNLIFENRHLPIFKAIFEPKTQKRFSKEDLYLGSLRAVPLHEVSHTLIRYHDAEARLEELFPILDELLADMLGTKCCGLLILKGVISQKELEAILLMAVARNFYHWLSLRNSPGRIHYALGGAIAQNFFLREGAIKEKKNLLYVDTAKLFISTDHLSRILEYYVGAGNYREVKKFVEDYGSFHCFKNFSSKLKGIAG